MKLRTVNQEDFGKLDGPYDVVVSASGYESRARFLATRLADRKVRISSRYAFAFKEHTQVCARPENDRCFSALGYNLLPCSGSSTLDARECFNSALLPLRACLKSQLFSQTA